MSVKPFMEVMMVRFFLPLVLLFFVACEPIKKPAEADASKPPAEARELPPATNTVEFEVEVDIDSKKPNGKGWDVGDGKPDPMVTFEAAGRNFKETKFEEDTTSATFTFGPMKLGEGDTLTVKVEDKDLKNHDAVGEGEFTFSLSKKSLTGRNGAVEIVVRIVDAAVPAAKVEAPTDPKLAFDVPAIVGRTQEEVAALLGKEDRCEPSEYGTRCYFREESVEVMFRKEVADWITVHNPEISFGKTSLVFLGIKYSSPTFENDDGYRWENISGYKEIGMFKGENGGVRYVYIRAFTLPDNSIGGPTGSAPAKINAAKEKTKSWGGKQCSNGKPCGDTCIAKNKKCRK